VLTISGRSQRRDEAASSYLGLGSGGSAEPASSVFTCSRQRREDRRRSFVLVALLATLGPGVMVMLADTDAGSVVTAAQSGARWGYALLPLEVALVPVLYLVMELTVRLGVVTGKGHARLVKDCFGHKCAVFSAVTLLITTTGALVTELAGLAGVGTMYGLPPAATVLFAAGLLGVIVLSGSYRRVERIGLTLGLFELAFLFAALRAHPSLHPIAASFLTLGPSQPSYLNMVAANIGAVVMPWMVYYQQAAVVDKGLPPKDLRLGRADTAVGAVITQVVMIAVLVAAAGVFTHRHQALPKSTSLTSVRDVWAAFAPFLGSGAGRLAFALGVAGAALVAAIVVSLSAAWAFAEINGANGSLNAKARQAPVFYTVYFVSLAVAALLTLACGPSVQLMIAVEISNSLLLPIVLGLLLALAWKCLSPPYRLTVTRSVLTVGVGVTVLALNVILGLHAIGT
jgi:Mn2+/Fe2+ NRAMP family transporter